jgi:hypothetical protein
VDVDAAVVTGRSVESVVGAAAVLESAPVPVPLPVPVPEAELRCVEVCDCA